MNWVIWRSEVTVLSCGSGHAAVPLRPAEDPGNVAALPGLSDWIRRAEAGSGGGALLRLHR